MKRRNDKGSTIVLVIVVLAIVGILASVALWMSLKNFQMKVTDSKIKNNFYSAESVLDQVCVGLQDYVSEAYVEAYTGTMEEYNASLTSAQRETRFRQLYKDALKKLVCTTNLAEDKDKYFNADVVEDCLDHSMIAAGTSVVLDCGSRDMKVSDSGITLCGISVTYTNAENITSIIETDIHLGIPSMRSITSTTLPDIFSYSLIANEGLEIEFTNGGLAVSGNVYAGSRKVNNPASTDDISIRTYTSLSFDNCDYLVVDGRVVCGGSKFSTSSQTQLWAENIQVNSGIVEINGNSYVSDDLTVSGPNTQIKLGSGNGKYYGYGSSTTNAAASSAIIVNGKGTNLDMTGLDELVVAGYSYIGTSKFDNSGLTGSSTNNNVMMGESISVKGDQIAYLIPGDCIGTYDDTALASSVFGRNPITYDEYVALLDGVTNSGYVMVNDKVVSAKTGNTLGHYLDGASINSCVSTIFDNRNGGLVYFYVNLSKEMAEQYYLDYYQMDKDGAQKLAKYADYYATDIKYNGHSSLLYTAGAYTAYNGTSKELKVTPGASLDVTSRISRMPMTFEALTTVLSTNYNAIEAGQRNKTVFQNYADSDKLNEIFGESGADPHGVKFSYSANGKNYEVVIASQGPYNYNRSASVDMSIIIADCDVVVNDNFKGMILCNGKISTKGSTNKIEPVTQEEARRLLAATFTVNGRTYTAYELFKGGNAGWIGGLNNPVGGASDPTGNTYNDLITYRNWIKK